MKLPSKLPQRKSMLLDQKASELKSDTIYPSSELRPVLALTFMLHRSISEEWGSSLPFCISNLKLMSQTHKAPI